MGRSPRRRFRRVYWDSCSWIALIQNEIVEGENRGALCRAVVDDATKATVEICTSALALTEVNKHPDSNPAAGAQKIKEFFENDYIVVVPLDRRGGELAREYMQRGYSKLKPADATHLACAAIANAEEFHTFDSKLLALDGKIDRLDGVKLKICKPSLGGPPLPLLEPEHEEEDDEPAGEGASDPESYDQTTAAEGGVPGGGRGTGVPPESRDFRRDVSPNSGGGGTTETSAEKASTEAPEHPAQMVESPVLDDEMLEEIVRELEEQDDRAATLDSPTRHDGTSAEPGDTA